MASRLRYKFVFDGRTKFNVDAVRFLKRLANDYGFVWTKAKRPFENCIRVFELLPNYGKSLTIIREKRGANVKNSSILSEMRTLGMVRPRSKKLPKKAKNVRPIPDNVARFARPTPPIQRFNAQVEREVFRQRRIFINAEEQQQLRQGLAQAVPRPPEALQGQPDDLRPDDLRDVRRVFRDLVGNAGGING